MDKHAEFLMRILNLIGVVSELRLSSRLSRYSFLRMELGAPVDDQDLMVSVFEVMPRNVYVLLLWLTAPNR